jgi:hypothetical protein
VVLVRTFVVAALLVIAAVPGARADLVYTMRTKALAMDPPAMLTHRMSLAADRMALTSETDGKSSHFVYRADKQVLWMIEPVTHEYTEIDAASVRALAAQVGPVLEQMREKMAQLPAEQSAQMEEILNMQAKGAQPQPEIELRKSGEKEKIAGYDCVRWDVLRDGVKSAEIWATKWSATGASKADFAVLTQLKEFLSTLHAASPATRDLGGGDLISEMDRVDGFPVRIRHFEDGMLASESTLESLDTKSVAASTFEVPAGYKQRAFGPAGR